MLSKIKIDVLLLYIATLYLDIRCRVARAPCFHTISRFTKFPIVLISRIVYHATRKMFYIFQIVCIHIQSNIE